MLMHLGVSDAGFGRGTCFMLTMNRRSYGQEKSKSPLGPYIQMHIVQVLEADLTTGCGRDTERRQTFFGFRASTGSASRIRDHRVSTVEQCKCEKERFPASA